MNTMTPHELRDRMTDLVATQPVARAGSSDDLTLARRHLVRRRTAQAFGGSLAAAAAVVATTGATTGLLGTPGGATAADLGASAPPAGSVLERCLALGAPVLDAGPFGAGTTVLTAATTGDYARAVLVSGDGQQWADCHLRGAGSTAGTVSTYAMNAPRPNRQQEFSYVGGSGPAPSFSMLERFPTDVASVRLRFATGVELHAPAVDGFVAFEVADGVDLGGSPSVESITQYAADGTVVGGPGLAPGDADLPVDHRSLVPEQPLDSVTVGEGR